MKFVSNELVGLQLSQGLPDWRAADAKKFTDFSLNEPITWLIPTTHNRLLQITLHILSQALWFGWRGSWHVKTLFFVLQNTTPFTN
jgi:hypothetical protein